jgi:transcriptional regulator with XRE-family HTH domain
VIDTSRLRAVLEARVTEEGLSWRKAAIQIGVSPSLLSRLKSGLRPDLDAYLRIVRWLGVSADDFVTALEPQPAHGASLVTEFAVLLGRQADLSEADRVYLQGLMRASLAYIESARSE